MQQQAHLSSSRNTYPTLFMTHHQNNKNLCTLQYNTNLLSGDSILAGTSVASLVQGRRWKRTETGDDGTFLLLLQPFARTRRGGGGRFQPTAQRRCSCCSSALVWITRRHGDKKGGRITGDGEPSLSPLSKLTPCEIPNSLWLV